MFFWFEILKVQVNIKIKIKFGTLVVAMKMLNIFSFTSRRFWDLDVGYYKNVYSIDRQKSH